jgi:hypothetical protein
VLRRTTIALGALWGILAVMIVWQLPTPSRPLVVVSLFFPVYYFLLSFYLQSRRDAAR